MCAPVPACLSRAGGLTGLKDGGMVDRVGLSAWRQRRRQQQEAAGGGKKSLPPCLVHVIERSSPFSGDDDAEACGEDAVQIVRCPKSGVNFFDLGDFERQFDLAKQRAGGRLDAYLNSLSTPQQQQQAAAAGRGQQHMQRELQHKQQRLSSAVVLSSARRSAAATAAVAAGRAKKS